MRFKEHYECIVSAFFPFSLKPRQSLLWIVFAHMSVYCGYTDCFRNKQFILMTTRDLLPSPLTPDKRALLQSQPTQSSSANIKTSLPSDSFSASPTSLFASQNASLPTNNHPDHLKLLWFHKKTEELRIYLHENTRIDKQHIRHIFEWQHQDEQEGQSVLKDLSLKVRSLIKENHELRMIGRSEDWEKMKAENEEMRITIDQMRRGQDAREKILSEQNQYLRDYIERQKTSNQKVIHSKHDKQEQIANNARIPITAYDISESNIGSLRKYILAYINTVIQANDEKMAAQQRYVATLEKRLSSITKFQAIISHLQFQKAVRMQESGRKSKNFSTGGPRIQGDCVQYQPHESPISQPMIEKPRYFKNKTCNEQPQNKEIVSLVLRSAQLQQDLTVLQEKYETQVESRIRGSSNREELLISIQKLNAQKKELQHLVRELQQRLKKQVNCPQSLREELSEIKKDLMSCGVENLSTIQRQISQLTIERNHLKKELSHLQQSIASGSKFSSTHKELFLLKEKNAQLEQNCRFYEQQIVEYEKELRKLSEENERRLAKNISRDFKEMKEQDLGWPSLAHQRITHTILRLQNIEKQLATAA